MRTLESTLPSKPYGKGQIRGSSPPDSSRINDTAFSLGLLICTVDTLFDRLRTKDAIGGPNHPVLLSPSQPLVMRQNYLMVQGDPSIFAPNNCKCIAGRNPGLRIFCESD